MKLKRTALSLLLSLAIVLAFIPVMAFAEAGWSAHQVQTVVYLPDENPATLSVDIEYDGEKPNLSYEWYKDGDNNVLSYDSSYATSVAGDYYCIVSDGMYAYNLLFTVEEYINTATCHFYLDSDYYILRLENGKAEIEANVWPVKDDFDSSLVSFKWYKKVYGEEGSYYTIPITDGIVSTQMDSKLTVNEAGEYRCSGYYNGEFQESWDYKVVDWWFIDDEDDYEIKPGTSAVLDASTNYKGSDISYEWYISDGAGENIELIEDATGVTYSPGIDVIGAFNCVVTAGGISQTKWFEVYYYTPEECTHKLVKTEAHAATCTEDGNIAFWTCTKCGRLFSDAKGDYEITEAKSVVKATGHQFGDWLITREPGYDEAGLREKTCSKCGAVEQETIPMLEKTSIADATVSGIIAKVYTGKALTQSPTVILDGQTLKAGSDYELSYSNNKLVGTAKVKITGIGAYKDSIEKTFNINPKGTSLSKLTAAKKGFTAKWKKQATQTTGYQIRYSLKPTMASAKTVTIGKNNTISKKITKLKAKKKYYVQVRTYKTVNGAKYYSAWSSRKYVTTKK